jgi:tetratricopeptide (TPR) repeat protein
MIRCNFVLPHVNNATINLSTLMYRSSGCKSSSFILATSYSNMGDYSKAHSYYERALDIWQRTLPPNHPSIRDVKESIEIVKRKCK